MVNMKVKNFLNNLKVFITCPAMLGFLHATILIALLFFWMDYVYSKNVYKEIVARTITADMSQKEEVLALLGAVYNLAEPRTEFFGGRGNIDFGPRSFFGSSRSTLQLGGACGDRVQVLGLALNTAGFEARVAQMKVQGVFGGHIVAEALINGRWIVLDPLFNLAFENADGSLATFSEIRNNWEYFKNQTPSDYNPDYSYVAVRYTNWKKIPIIMPAIKKTLDLLIGEEARREISLRAYFWDVWRAYLIGGFILYFIVVVWTLAVIRGKRTALKEDDIKAKN